MINLARENILGRVRTALRVQAPRPAPPTTSAIWPPIGDLETRFREEFAAVKGELLPDADSLTNFLTGFAKVARAGEGTVRDADLGVTGCECLIAQTGSIVVSTLAAGGRALSVLPPVHLVLARRDQLVPDLAAAIHLLRQRYEGRWPSALSVITGPSRTADIEKILVMGAHGPKRLVLAFQN